MRAGYLMLTALGGGVILGGLLGATTSTTMKPMPEPAWRHAPPSEQSHPESADTETQGLSAYWSLADRTPTWKRHLHEYQTANAIRSYDVPPTEPAATRGETPEASAGQRNAAPAAFSPAKNAVDAPPSGSVADDPREPADRAEAGA
jgi:hypothetical protein